MRKWESNERFLEHQYPRCLWFEGYWLLASPTAWAVWCEGDPDEPVVHGEASGLAEAETACAVAFGEYLARMLKMWQDDA